MHLDLRGVMLLNETYQVDFWFVNSSFKLAVDKNPTHLDLFSCFDEWELPSRILISDL